MTEMPSQTTALPPTPPPHDISIRRGDKSSYGNGTIADRLVLSERATYELKNNPQIQAMMLPFGYNGEKITRFGEVQAAAAEAQTTQQIEYGEKTGTYDKFEKRYKIAKIELSSIVKVAKVALKNDSMLGDKLNLYGKKYGKTNDIFAYMDSFYNAILRERKIIEQLTAYGYNEARIIACKETYLEARETYNIYNSENAEAMESTRIRDEKMAELNEWMYDYYALSKVAYLQRNLLSEQPQNNQ